MKQKTKNSGSVLLIVVFTIALLTAFVVGMLQLNSEQLQIMKNQIYATQASLIAQAGLADAFARVRTNKTLPPGFKGSFAGGSYAVTITGTLPDPNFTARGISPQGFTTDISADVTIDQTNYAIRIDNLRFNQ